MKSRMTAWMATLLMSSFACSDYTGVVEDGYWTTQVELGGTQVEVYVVDLYVTSDNPNDALFAVSNFVGNYPGAPFYQALQGSGWLPDNIGGPLDTGALRYADSFVTIGGFDLSSSEPPQQIPGAGIGTYLGPYGPHLDWYRVAYESSGVTQSVRLGNLVTFIGRFSFPQEFSLEGSSLVCLWNQGAQTPVSQGSFIVTGSPDNCPDDPNKSEPGNCGCGVPETDVFGDLDCDGDYDIDDARLAMTTFGIEEAEEDTCPADVDGDGSIEFSDVLIILNDWGACP